MPLSPPGRGDECEQSCRGEEVPPSPLAGEFNEKYECGEQKYGKDETECKCVSYGENKNVNEWENFWETPEGNDVSFWNLSG